MTPWRPPVAYPIDSSGARRKPIPYLSATLTAKHLQVGKWSVTALLTPDTAKIGAGWRVVFDGPPLPGFGGPVDTIEIRVGDDSSPDKRPPTITLSGPDDTTVIDERLAYPNPALTAGSQDRAYDIRTGTASTVILDYVGWNAGSLALAARRVPNFGLGADPAVGGPVSGDVKARFSPLLSEIVAPLAEQAGLRVWITSTTSGARTFHVDTVTDRTSQARFSLALRNLMSLRYKRTAPTATAIVGGGGGEEEARQFVVRNNDPSAAQWRRREAFYDLRAASVTDSKAELTAGADKRLAESDQVEQVDVVPIDTDRLQFGRDYSLGDKVAVEVGQATGIKLTAVVREVEVTVQRQSSRRLVKVQPKVGTLGASGLLKSQSQLAEVLARLGRLERR